MSLPGKSVAVELKADRDRKGRPQRSARRNSDNRLPDRSDRTRCCSPGIVGLRGIGRSRRTLRSCRPWPPRARRAQIGCDARRRRPGRRRPGRLVLGRAEVAERGVQALLGLGPCWWMSVKHAQSPPCGPRAAEQSSQCRGPYPPIAADAYGLPDEHELPVLAVVLEAHRPALGATVDQVAVAQGGIGHLEVLDRP